jgi:uncharacterized phage protein (TIGR01671 family)
MREIKFRVWCLNRKEWEKEDCYLTPDGRLFRKYVLDGRYRDDTSTHIVEQYTGLKDKNGVEIYEGDRYQFQWMQEIYKGVIVYRENSFVIKLTDLAGEFYEQINTRLIEGHFGTVIGNIHEVKE